MFSKYLFVKWVENEWQILYNKQFHKILYLAVEWVYIYYIRKKLKVGKIFEQKNPNEHLTAFHHVWCFCKQWTKIWHIWNKHQW